MLAGCEGGGGVILAFNNNLGSGCIILVRGKAKGYTYIDGRHPFMEMTRNLEKEREVSQRRFTDHPIYLQHSIISNTLRDHCFTQPRLYASF